MSNEYLENRPPVNKHEQRHFRREVRDLAQGRSEADIRYIYNSVLSRYEAYSGVPSPGARRFLVRADEIRGDFEEVLGTATNVENAYAGTNAGFTINYANDESLYFDPGGYGGWTPDTAPTTVYSGLGSGGGGSGGGSGGGGDNVFDSSQGANLTSKFPELNLLPDYPGSQIQGYIPQLSEFFGEDSPYVLDYFGVADENTERSRRILPENLQIAQREAVGLSRDLTDENRDLFQEGLDRFLPGNREMIATSVRNIQDNLRGRLNADVQSQIVRFGARRSLQSGIGVGGLGRNLTARDIGRTSQDLQTLGFQQAQSLYQQQAQNALATQVRPEQMFVPIYGQYNQTSLLTPSQALAGAEGNINRQYNARFNISQQQIAAAQAEYNALNQQAQVGIALASQDRAESAASYNADVAADAARDSAILQGVGTIVGAALGSPWLGAALGFGANQATQDDVQNAALNAYASGYQANAAGQSTVNTLATQPRTNTGVTLTPSQASLGFSYQPGSGLQQQQYTATYPTANPYAYAATAPAPLTSGQMSQSYSPSVYNYQPSSFSSHTDGASVRFASGNSEITLNIGN